MKKFLITILALVAFVALFAETNSLWSQILWSSGALALLTISGKLVEKYCLTDEEKEETV